MFWEQKIKNNNRRRTPISRSSGHFGLGNRNRNTSRTRCADQSASKRRHAINRITEGFQWIYIMYSLSSPRTQFSAGRPLLPQIDTNACHTACVRRCVQTNDKLSHAQPGPCRFPHYPRGSFRWCRSYALIKGIYN